MAGTTSNESRNPKAGLDALLTPDNCALILIDHQPFQFAGLRSHDSQTIVNNVVGLAKAAKAFGVPTLFSTVVEDRGGFLLKPLQDVFPDQKPLDRTWINAWEDPQVVDWVKKTGRRKIVIAALWTEICLAMPAIDKAEPRARQNVVLEMGMLIAALGRSNVAILKKQHLEAPSDANGILYLSFNDHVKETVPKLVDRLQKAGFKVDSSKIAYASS